MRRSGNQTPSLIPDEQRRRTLTSPLLPVGHGWDVLSGGAIDRGRLKFIQVLNEQGCDYLFLTNNSSKDSGQYAEKITRLGLPISRGKVLTSGEATAMHIQAQKPGARVYVVGTSALENEFRERGFTFNRGHA